jgi:methyl-accepting chemotaxis protein
MDSATQTTAATAEESAAAAQELNAQAFALDRVVDQLESLVKGAARRHAAAARGSGGSRAGDRAGGRSSRQTG